MFFGPCWSFSEAESIKIPFPLATVAMDIFKTASLSQPFSGSTGSPDSLSKLLSIYPFFLFFIFFLFSTFFLVSCGTYVGFWAHVKTASRIVSYRAHNATAWLTVARLGRLTSARSVLNTCILLRLAVYNGVRELNSTSVRFQFVCCERGFGFRVIGLLLGLFGLRLGFSG